MPIPEDFVFTPEVDSVDSLPVEAKALYTKNAEGKYVLDPVMRKRLDTSGLNTALTTERKKAKELEKLVSGFRGLGLGETPEEALAAIQAAQDDADDGTPAGDKKVAKLEELRAKLKAEFEGTLKTEVSKREEQLNKMQRALQKNMVEREAIAALAKHEGSQDLLLPHIVGRLGLVEDDNGNMAVRVLDKDGDPLSDGLGGFMSVDTFVANMRADAKYAVAFKASGKGGSGAKGGQGKTGSSGGGSEGKSSVAKISAGLSTLR